MANTNKLEVWLRGPLPGIIPALQPVAHALLQVQEELNELLADFNEDKLWQRPAGVASVGFHLQHLSGVLNRLFTYAKGHALTQEQLSELSAEGAEEDTITTPYLVQAFNKQVDTAIAQLMEADEEELTQPRCVGRAQLPSTVLGLYVHAAEHTMRHIGQLLVTIKVLT